MKINKLKINSYGKLQNKEINLNEKINIIYGENESGKSTIFKFILNSFYGTSKNKKGREISDFEQYKPWHTDEFSGKLEYELDNGQSFEIYREFGKKNPKIFNNKLEEISKQFNIDKNKGNEFFYEQTKIDEELFLATSAILQENLRLEKYNAKELVKSGLSMFKNISARDENTKNIIKELTSKEATIVLDPVLMYDFSNIHANVKLPKNKYLIVYSYDRWMIEKEEVDEIKSYAKSKGLITVSVGTYHKWCDMNINCDCLEWIEYFKNAEEVITDTFHGTILSIISNKPVAVYIRSKINKNKLDYLLKQLKISDREMKEITKKEIERIMDNTIDYTMLNENLNELRKNSIKYLYEAIGGNNE